MYFFSVLCYNSIIKLWISQFEKIPNTINSMLHLKLKSRSILAAVFFVFIFAAAFFVVNNYAYAGSADNMLFGGQSGNFQAATGLGTLDIRIVIARVIRYALGFLGVIAVSIIIYGGWLYMTSQGDQGQIDRAKQYIINAVIGLVIILSSFGIASFVLNSLLKASCKLCMSKRVGFSTSTTISISLSSVFSPRATEPKIPSLVIPKLSPNCCLKLANFSKHSCNLTITCIFSCCYKVHEVPCLWLYILIIPDNVSPICLYIRLQM